MANPIKERESTKKKGDQIITVTELSNIFCTEDFESKKSLNPQKDSLSIGLPTERINNKPPQTKEVILETPKDESPFSNPVPKMIDRLNAVLKNRGLGDDVGKKLNVEDLKKLSELVNPALKSLDLSVNQELNLHLQRLESSIANLNTKVDVILNSQNTSLRKERRKDISVDDSLVLSAYRERSQEELPSRASKATCPVHAAAYEGLREQASKSGFHSATTAKLLNPWSTAKSSGSQTGGALAANSADSQDHSLWLPLHANRFFLNSSHRVQVAKRRHPLQWLTIEEEQAKSAKSIPLQTLEVGKGKRHVKKIGEESSTQTVHRPAKKLVPTVQVELKKTQTETSQFSRGPSLGVPSKAPRKTGFRTREEVYQNKEKSTRFREDQQKGDLYKQNQEDPIKVTINKEVFKEPIMGHSKSSAGGLQMRRDQALMNRKKITIIEGPPINHLPWHKKRVTPVK